MANTQFMYPSHGIFSYLRGILIFAALAIAFPLAAAPASATGRFALVIGNSNYMNINVLPNPEKDAALVGKALTALNFKTTILINLDLAAFKKAITEFTDSVSDAGPDSIALIYYAGHGVQIDGVNYLVPIDASAKSKSGVVLSSVSAADIIGALDDAAAETNVIILDACRDNPFKADTRGFNRGLAQISAPTGTIVAYATAPGQTASDGRGGNSPYANALAKNLGASGISIEEVFKRVRVDVNVDTNGNQTPWEETSLTKNIQLVPAATPAPTTVDASPADTPASELDIKRAYLKAVNANSVESYDAFIAAYPKSEQAVQALKNIEALTDERNWREASSQNTLGSYAMYLSLHRDGNYVDEANAKLAAIRQQSRQVTSQGQEGTLQPQTPVAEQFITKPGFDVFGTDYRTIKGVGFEDCIAACKTDSVCRALTYARAKQWCFMKQSGELLLRNDNADSAIRPSLVNTIVESRIQVLPRTDMVGEDYANSDSIDFKGCLRQCEADSRCAAFSYVRKSHACWLTSSAVGQKANTKVDSGIKQ